MLQGFRTPLDKSKVCSDSSKGNSNWLPKKNSGALNVSFKSGTKGVKLNGK